MSESGFKEWFEAQYDGLPCLVRLRQLKSELQSHLNAIQKLGSEQQELERLEQAWTDSFYGWQARGMKMLEAHEEGHKKKSIALSQADWGVISMLIGFAVNSMEKDGVTLQVHTKKAVDRYMLARGRSTYFYKPEELQDE